MTRIEMATRAGDAVLRACATRAAGLVPLVLLVGAVAMADPDPAAACSGGLDIRYAIGHTRGAIAIGRITSEQTLVDFSIVLDVDIQDVVRGSVDDPTRIRGAMGQPCEQGPEVGRTVLILEDVQLPPPGARFPQFYLIDGVGGYPRVAVEAALAGLPDTATLGACDDPVPDFREVVRSASRVFIGDVTSVENPGTDGFGSQFTVRVGDVLRGRVHRWPMEIRDLQGSPCSPDITAAHGERIALALDGTVDVGGGPVRANSIAYITGDAPASWAGSDPRIPYDEVYRLAGVELDTRGYAVDPPNTATADHETDATQPGLMILLAAFVSALLVSLRRRPWRRGGSAP
jgi:hypothetical protein